MLRVWFGTKPEAIYNTSLYFKNQYKDKWITDEFSKKIIKDIDNSEVVGSEGIKSPVLGLIPPTKLSGGVKTLILINNFPGKIFNASNCGDNCAKWLLEMGEKKSFTINLLHPMDFGRGEFEIRILNDSKLIVHNMLEFLDAAAKYLQEDET